MTNRISSIVPDYNREKLTKGKYEPGKRLIRSIRLYQKEAGKRTLLSKIVIKICVIRHRLWSIVCGAEIPLDSKIDIGLVLPHPNGVVIHPNTKIGPNCFIMQQVTIGTRQNDPNLPVIEGDVEIGAGAKILGGIHIGEHAKIGANAVVLCDVPAEATAVGIPARIISKKES